MEDNKDEKQNNVLVVDIRDLFRKSNIEFVTVKREEHEKKEEKNEK